MELAERLTDIRQRIAAACERSGRTPDSVRLLAVTKTHPPEVVDEAVRLGLTLFGENKVQEARAKIPQCSSRATWHMIGHLQTNKARDAVEWFSMVESVDSLKLAQRLNRLAERDNYPPLEVLLQCNVSGEASKSGFELDQWVADKAQFDAFVAAIEQIVALPNIIIRGLMTMAPFSDNPEDARPTFQSLAALRQVLQMTLPQCNWTHLSMGMTDDFEVAIEEGATLVRVGRAIFGERD